MALCDLNLTLSIYVGVKHLLNVKNNKLTGTVGDIYDDYLIKHQKR